MKKIVNALAKILILLCIIVGVFLVIQSNENRIASKKKMQIENGNPKAVALKKFLLGFKKPERVEVFNYTKKFENDVNQILDMKLPTDPNSNFYITIQFFTDETDDKAPLVAQIKFLDLKTDNLLKEQSINLE